MPESDEGQVREEMPMPSIGDEVWKFILDRSKYPKALSHIFKGEMWVIKTGEDGVNYGVWERHGEQLMNDRGARFFTTVLISSMTPDKIATWISDEETTRMARDMRENIIDIITVRCDEFNINPANASMVVDIIDHFYFSNLTASRKGTILETLKPTFSRIETYSPEKKSRITIPKFGGN